MTESATARTGRSALLLGATGLVGGHVLNLLLGDPAYRRVAVLGRRGLQREHAKLTQHVGDLGRMADHADAFAVDHVFCCLGTTLATAGSREAFRRVDHDYVVESARLAAARGARSYLLVSASGASARSRVFYSRTKGEAEHAVRAQSVESMAILRPSLLLGARMEHRPGEAFAQRLAPALNRLMVGPLARWRPIEAGTVARAMVRLAAESPRGVRVVENDEIERRGGA